MAFDGLVISNLVYELNQTILNAKISKIAACRKWGMKSNRANTFPFALPDRNGLTSNPVAQSQGAAYSKGHSRSLFADLTLSQDLSGLDVYKRQYIINRKNIIRKYIRTFLMDMSD